MRTSASLTKKSSAPNDSVVCCGTTTARLRCNPSTHAIHLFAERFNSAPVRRFATLRIAGTSTDHSLQSTITSDDTLKVRCPHGLHRNAVATPGKPASSEYQAIQTPSKTVFTFSNLKTSNKFTKDDLTRCC